MHILICNDDGVNAPGIRSLANGIRKELKARTTVVAPMEECSAKGHAVSLETPLRVTKMEEDVYGCSGFPADCVTLGLNHILKKKSIRPDLILSGINEGANLAQDIYYSGTVGAAREGAFQGFPSIAVSLVTGLGKHGQDGGMEKALHFETAASFVARFLTLGGDKLISPLTVLNINVPNLPKGEIGGVALGHLGFRYYGGDVEERRDRRGVPYYWVQGLSQGHKEDEGSDCFLVEKGIISLTPLNLFGQVSDQKPEWSSLVKELNR